MSSSEVLDAADFAVPDAREKLVRDDDLDLRQATSRFERELIVKAIARTEGNRTEAARLLGIARPQLYAKLRDLGLEDEVRRR